MSVRLNRQALVTTPGSSLCKAAWDEDDMLAYDTVSSDFGEMCEACPYLGEEFKAHDRAHPGLFKRAFIMFSMEEAYSLNQRIKEAEIGIMEVELKGHEMDKEIIKMLMDLMEGSGKIGPSTARWLSSAN
jgi:hypothetical protein